MKTLLEIYISSITNSPMLFYLSNIPLEYINTILIALITLTVKRVKLEKADVIKYAKISCIFCIIERILIPSPFCIIVFIATSIILLHKIFKVDLKGIAILQTTVFLFTLGIKSVFSNIFYEFFNMLTMSEMARNVAFNLSTHLMVTLNLIVLFLITRELKVSTEIFKGSTKREIKNATTITGIGIIALYGALAKATNANLAETVILTVFDFIVISLVYYVIIEALIRAYKIRNVSMNIERLEKHNENLSLEIETIRGFKHDFNNIVQAMSGYIKMKDMKALEKYFNKLFSECSTMKNKEALNPKIIKEPAIYNLLANKFKIAEASDIKMNIETEEIDFTDKNIYDVSRMLGILLDNALEATEECKEKVINVRFRKDKENKHLIIIENTYNNSNIDTTKIFEKNYTTKKERGNSGLGLYEVKKILERNTSLDLYTTKDDEIFKQQLEMYK